MREESLKKICECCGLECFLRRQDTIDKPSANLVTWILPWENSQTIVNSEINKNESWLCGECFKVHKWITKKSHALVSEGNNEFVTPR